ncbi:MAG: pyrroline-5-carboxylate reductase [Bacteroidales bacterium]|jgi:pyrroline-5-carboxylate reductase|nr:pyrroline-5-carboxylate reductase [Bacteroidales bacterium]MBR6278034.1 pyrroline-5-carboxylate reductase [Bacteroidales bacterium]
MNITIVGCGNLGFSIAKGLANKQKEFNLNITATDPEADLERIRAIGINAVRDNVQAVKDSEIIFLCVKPWVAKDVIEEIEPALNNSQVLVSPVAGLSIDQINAYSSKKVSVFRIMPNIAASINQSVTCVSHDAEDEDIEKTLKILNILGKTIVVDENKINAATILTGSGIAYILRFLRAMTEGGIEIGFPSKIAQEIAAQTMKGTVELLLEEGVHPEQLIDRVCTPSGTTIRGLNEMEKNGFSSSVIQGILSSYGKIAK